MADKDSREEIIKAFKLFDDNCTGKITFSNLKRIAQELGENIADEELQVNINCLKHKYINYCRYLASLQLVVWLRVFSG